MNIGQKIKDLRIQLGISVDELAAKLGKNRATIYRYERGDIENMPLDVLEPLSKALDTTPAYLMGWEENETRINRSNNMTIGDFVKSLRLKNKITLDELSNILNISANDLKLYETNILPMSMDVFGLIIIHFKLSLSDLVSTNLKDGKYNEYVKHFEYWCEKIGDAHLTDSEYEKIIEYADFLIFQRSDKDK